MDEAAVRAIVNQALLDAFRYFNSREPKHLGDLAVDYIPVAEGDDK